MKTPFQWLTRPPLAIFLLFTVQAGVVAADDPAVNRMLASQCAQCHGTDGYASGDFDDLAGEDIKDMSDDLLDMKGEDKPENIMDHQAIGYSDDQIRRIASYYATLPENQSEGGGESEPEEEQESEEEQETEEEREEEDEPEEEEEPEEEDEPEEERE